MNDLDTTPTGAGPQSVAPRYWVLLDDHRDPRILLRTGPDGMRSGDIDRWYGARRKWRMASGYLSSSLMMGDLFGDADEVEPDEVPRLIAYLARRSRGGRTDRRLPYDDLKPEPAEPDGGHIDAATMSLLLREADLGIPPSRSRAPDTAAVRAYRETARAEVAAIRRRGGMLDMPVEPWDWIEPD